MAALSDSSSVAVDGSALRRIREQKRLTQLYVSKVVGVTTDTVSRWENNRYPTIKRENALKLAEALEVGLEEILKQDRQEDPGSLAQHKKGLTRWWPLAIPLVLTLFLAWLLLPMHESTVGPTLQTERLVPLHIAPGQELLVQVKIASNKALRGAILKEEYPKGWQLLSSELEAASIDEEAGVARWIFRNPVLPLHLHYRLVVPKDVALDQEFRLMGELIANPDGQQVVLPVEALNTTRIRPFHWADSNANYVIDDVEILVFSELAENTSELDDEWFRVEKIWHAGSYRWDDENFVFVPASAFEEPVR